MFPYSNETEEIGVEMNVIVRYADIIISFVDFVTYGSFRLTFSLKIGDFD